MLLNEVNLVLTGLSATAGLTLALLRIWFLLRPARVVPVPVAREGGE